MSTVTSGSSIVRCTWAITSATLSPGSRRKLTIAVAVPGIALSLLLPCSIVGAVVVRIIALVALSPASSESTSGFVSHRLAKAARWPTGIAGASVVNMPSAAPSRRAGIWW